MKFVIDTRRDTKSSNACFRLISVITKKSHAVRSLMRAHVSHRITKQKNTNTKMNQEGLETACASGKETVCTQHETHEDWHAGRTSTARRDLSFFAPQVVDLSVKTRANWSSENGQADKLVKKTIYSQLLLQSSTT